MDFFAILTAITGYKLRKEGFQDSSAPTPTPAESSSLGLFSKMSLIGLVFALLFCIAAARLSWCYNSKIGTGTFLSVVYATLCFFFPSFYTTYYSFFLLDCSGSGTLTENIKNLNNLGINSLNSRNNQKGGRR
jgi:hypothetical protein